MTWVYVSNRDLARASSSPTGAPGETELNIDGASTLEIIHDHIRDEDDPWGRR